MKRARAASSRFWKKLILADDSPVLGTDPSELGAAGPRIRVEFVESGQPAEEESLLNRSGAEPRKPVQSPPLIRNHSRPIHIEGSHPMLNKILNAKDSLAELNTKDDMEFGPFEGARLRHVNGFQNLALPSLDDVCPWDVNGYGFDLSPILRPREVHRPRTRRSPSPRRRPPDTRRSNSGAGGLHRVARSQNLQADYPDAFEMMQAEETYWSHNKREQGSDNSMLMEVDDDDDDADEATPFRLSM